MSRPAPSRWACPRVSSPSARRAPGSNEASAQSAGNGRRRRLLLNPQMARLAIVTSSPESVEGGHLVIARSLVAAALEMGHDATLLLTPDCAFGRQASAYFETWRTDIALAAGGA